MEQASGEDLAFEEQLLKDPYNFGAWSQYLQHKAPAGPKTRNLLYERALKNLPGSYKLWLHYLRERREQVRGRVPTDGAVVAVNVRFPLPLFLPLPPPATP